VRPFGPGIIDNPETHKTSKIFKIWPISA
jgi:hypothetical protein